jgi:hypothetical protein
MYLSFGSCFGMNAKEGRKEGISRLAMILVCIPTLRDGSTTCHCFENNQVKWVDFNRFPSNLELSTNHVVRGMNKMNKSINE